MPRAGYSSVAKTLTGGFTDPFGDSRPGPVYAPPTGAASDSGVTPGGFGVDVTSPEAFVTSMQQNNTEADDFISGLGAALFGKKGGIVGGVPVLGDLGRFVGDNPLSRFAYELPGHAADVVGGALEHVSAGYEDLTPRYDALPEEYKTRFDPQIAKNPDIANHLRYRALVAYAQDQQLLNPQLNPTLNIPRGSLADTVGWAVGDFLGQWQQDVERGIAGAGRPGSGGLNQLEQIVAVGSGKAAWSSGDTGLNSVEHIVYDKYTSGDWSADQALNFLAYTHQGLSHNKALEIAGQFATDPTVVGSFGAGALAKLGLSGASLVAREGASGAKLLAGAGRISGTERGTELIRLLSKPYVAIQNTAIGRGAQIARTIIDPLHAIGQNRPAGEGVVDIASDATPRAVAAAYGEANHLNILRWGRSVGSNGELYDKLTEDIATYGTNVARRVLAQEHQASMLAHGLGFDLLQTVPGDILDDLAHNAPKGFAQYVKDESAKFRVLSWDEAAKANLAERLSSMYGFKSADEYLRDLAKMNPDELGLLHAATYGRVTKNLLTALGQSAALYAGKLPLDRLVLLNRDTLTTLGAQGILERVAGKVTTAEKVAEVRAAQELYPELRYVSIDGGNPARSIERFEAWLQGRLDEGVLPAQVTASELGELPTPLGDLADQMKEAWTLGFRPEDQHLWGLEFGLDGKYRAATVPWVDHVANTTPAFRAGRALKLNIAGQPIVGGVVRAASKPLDYIEAGARTMKAKVTSASITEDARTRFLGQAVAKGGMTEHEARTVFQGVLDAAQVQKTTARGLTERNMWEQTRHLVPARLRLTGFGPRELMGMVLDAYEGDLRFVGLTQKLTGRAKVLLQPLGGNLAGYISENFYPTVKFRLSPIFQTQERIEPIVLNAQRGVNFVLGNKMSEADKLTQGIIQRLVDTSIVRAGDIDQAEFSAMALVGDESKRVLTGHVARDFWNALSDVQGVKRVNMLRTFQKGLGAKLRGVWEGQVPGAWDDIVNEMSAKAGRVISDDEAAVRYLSEQMLANEVHVNQIIRPGARAADFDAAINTQAWHVPATIGELRPLDLDFLAKRMQFPLEGGRVLQDSNDIRAALADGSLKWDTVQEALEFAGAHPDFVNRVQRAFEFSWNGFWNTAARRFNLSRGELGRLQRMMSRSADLRGMSPVEFMSQVFSPMIAEGTDATIEELGKAVSVLRAPKKIEGTAEMLMSQLADIFTAHLDPSAQRTLLDAFQKELPGDIQAAYDAGKPVTGQALQRTLENLRGGWTKETNGAFAKRVISFMETGEETDPDVLRAVQHFGKWSRSALQDGLLSAGRPNPYSDLLTRVAGIETNLAAPFNYTEQMLVNQATNAMRLKEQDAFRLQYFARERSWLERSVNHPFFGIYPASYMWGKIAPEIIRFVAREPFGVKTGAAAYALADVEKAMAAQREYDPEFDKQVETLGHSQTMWFLGYLLPAVPWDIGAAMPSWMRDVAAQGLANEDRVAKGQAPKPVDLFSPLHKVADYVSPFRSAFQVQRVAEEVLAPNEPVKPKATLPGSGIVGPTRGTDLGPVLAGQQSALEPSLDQEMAELRRMLGG
jgi:polyhydroxyalkanoate synthesis regulator phasin